MSISSRAKRIFTIRPGTPFLKTLAETLCNGELTELYKYDSKDPLSLAKVTIYVPTRRAARVLRSEFVEVLGGKSSILPVIKALGETDDDSGFFDIETPATIDLSPPVSKTTRLIELARLILAWRNSLPDAIRAVHMDSPLIAPASPADAIWLARSLAEVIDAMETEAKDWSSLKNLTTLDHAKWWELTAEFLQIASVYWPSRLQELNRSSASRHSNAILMAEAERLKNAQNTGPIIVAGSTGAIPAIAELIASVASLEQGIIVLPGLDLTMSDEQWDAINENPDDPSSRTHSQYGLHKLLNKLGVLRSDIKNLGIVSDNLINRAEIFSAALAPAKSTADWNEWRESKTPGFFISAFENASLIEASNEREEATAIAIALRLALEKPSINGQSKAALITPDRALARRVAIELNRFGIIADDSAGTPIASTSQATLIQLTLEAILKPGDPVSIVSLLKHPLGRFGLSQENYLKGVTALEIFALRGGKQEITFGNISSVFEEQIAAHQIDYHAPEWRKSLPEDYLTHGRELANKIQKASEALRSVVFKKHMGSGWTTEKLSLDQWAIKTGQVIEAICADEIGDLSSLWSGEIGVKLSSLLAELMECGAILEADGQQWIDIFIALITGESTKPPSMANPRVFIFGAMESRLQNVDTIIIGGLNEGIWPTQTSQNPFLSRSMKTAIGLEPPERSVGQLAHDFEMANGTLDIIYTRSLRQGSTPSVASRWLQRLMALAGDDLNKTMHSQGEKYLAWARMIDVSSAEQKQKPAQRPSPMPDAEFQPVSYSFSEVSKLRRDPYAIYARRILKLSPLDDYNQEPGATERGTLYHKIVEQYSNLNLIAGTPAAEMAMTEIINHCFDDENLPIHIDVIWRPRFINVAREFMKWDAERRGLIKESYYEARASQLIPEAGIKLTGIADRIDIKHNGKADIIDYKTGLSPSLKQARSLLDPQLSLEAAALKRGAFRTVSPKTTEDLFYVRLKPGSGFTVDKINNEDSTRSKNPTKSADELSIEAIDQLSKFVQALREKRHGFASRLIPEQQNRYGAEYDHLARVAEWSTTEAGDADAE